MMEKTVFKKHVNEVLIKGGFFRKGTTCYLTSKDVIIVIGLQKSDFAEKFYFNFGILLRGLSDIEYPNVHKCHINGRLSGLFPEAGPLLDEAGTLDGGSEAKISELLDFIRSEVIPFCNDSLTLIRIQHHISVGRFSKMLVMQDAKKLLAQS